MTEKIRIIIQHDDEKWFWVNFNSVEEKERYVKAERNFCLSELRNFWYAQSKSSRIEAKSLLVEKRAAFAKS